MQDSLNGESSFITTSFPGSLFSASIVVEKTTMEAEKREPGNEVGFINISSADYQGNQLLYNHLSNIEPLHLYRVA